MWVELQMNTRKLLPVFFLGSVITVDLHAEFIEDSQTSLNFRNFYFDRQLTTTPNVGSWSQGIGAKFESGYTETPLQVGLDASVNYAVRLNDHNSARADTNFPYNKETGQLEKDYYKYGATLKLKLNQTELKVGELNPKNPIAFVDESRQLITNYLGVMVESKEIKDLKITAGRLTKVSGRNDDKYRKITLSSYVPAYESDGLNFLGLDYSFNKKWSGSYWYGQLEDIYSQNYLSASYKTQTDNTKIKIDANYFNNKDDGQAFYGKIDSQSFGIMNTLNVGSHTFSTGIQKNTGDSVFPTLSGYAPQLYLNAWSILPFINPNELTWHFNYVYDFRELGLNGLKTRIAYHHGDDIKRAGFKDNKETEKLFSLMYKVPAGMFKDLSFEWRYTDVDIKYGAGYLPGNDFKEHRLITTYTYKF